MFRSSFLAISLTVSLFGSFVHAQEPVESEAAAVEIIGVEDQFGPPTFFFCSGYNSRTRDLVTGSCSNGFLNVRNSTTGNLIFGTCQDSGFFVGYESPNNDLVTGTCH
jgi:hypothetical protein